MWKIIQFFSIHLRIYILFSVREGLMSYVSMQKQTGIILKQLQYFK
jgi:hypothetical protein